MSAGAVSKAVKPQLRGLLHDQIKKHLTVAITLCIGAGVAQHFLLNDARKVQYAEFYRTYDIEKDFQRIKNLGLFDSCGPDS